MKQKPVEGDLDAGGGTRPRPILVGWKEYLALPEWGIRRLKVKIDTGARTSALDALSYDLVSVDDGTRLMANIRLALHRKHPDHQMVQAPVLRMVMVRNSSGMREQRPLIETYVQIGSVRKRIRLTLTNRAGMRFRMILGREALQGDFVVDVSKKFLLQA